MRALAASVLVLLAAALAAGVDPVRACSCALPDPRAALAQADGAFVGKLVSRRDDGQGVVLTFSVEKALKGAIRSTVEVSTAGNSAACGIEAPIGSRVGLVLERRGGAWYGHLCWQFQPEELSAAALPLPPPNGRGPVALIVGGEFGTTRLIALDGQGRTLAYGRGRGRAGLVSVCPGKQRLAELAYTGSGTTLAIRGLRTLRVLRRQRLSLPGERHAQRIACEDRAGASVLVFARGPVGDSPARSALYRVRAARLRLGALWNGPAFDAAFTSSSAYLNAGMSGKLLLRVDVRIRSVRRLATLPGATTSLVINERETSLAGVHARLDRPSQIVRVDLAQQRVETARLSAPEVYGQVFWLPPGDLVFAPAYGADTGRVLDAGMRTQDRFRWTAGSAALVGSRLFGTDRSDSLVRAELPRGSRVVRKLPGRPTLIVSAS